MVSMVAKVKVKGKFERPEGYITYIFQDLSTCDYIWATLVPNWNMLDIPHIDDVGYLKYREAIGGKDTWYDAENNTHVLYKHTDVYFEGFILEKERLKELTL